MPMSNEMQDTCLSFSFFLIISPVNSGTGYVLKYKVYLVVFWLLDLKKVMKCPWKWPALGRTWVLAVTAWEMWCNQPLHSLVSVSSLPDMGGEFSGLQHLGVLKPVTCWALAEVCWEWWCRRWRGCDSPKAPYTPLTVTYLRNMWCVLLI